MESDNVLGLGISRIMTRTKKQKQKKHTQCIEKNEQREKERESGWGDVFLFSLCSFLDIYSHWTKFFGKSQFPTQFDQKQPFLCHEKTTFQVAKINTILAQVRRSIRFSIT